MTMYTESKGLLDSKTVATYLGISEATLCRMRQDGSGPAFIDVRGRPRYRETALSDWLDMREGHASAD